MKGKIVTQNLTINTRLHTKPPVILVPGIMGSDAKGGARLVYPSLPAEMPAKQSDLQIHNPGSDSGLDPVGWKALKNKLGAHYEVYECPYDWRLDLSQQYYDAESGSSKQPYELYLLPVIRKAKDPDGDGTNNYETVDIVAHSMGGLLVRSYIQSMDFAFDIDRFAMVGTPNHGSINAYFIWGGGDAKTIDVLLGTNKDTRGVADTPNFYAHTINNLYKAINKTDLYGFPHYTENGVRYEDVQLATGYSQKDVRKFIRQYGSALRQLMPTFAFLSFDAGSLQPLSNADNKNTWLESINNPGSLHYVQMVDGSGYVRTRLFGANALETFYKLPVTPYQGTGLWEDGAPAVSRTTPKTEYLSSSGDGTVPYTASLLLSGVSVTGAVRQENHSSLIKAYADDIVNFLDEGRSFPSASVMTVAGGRSASLSQVQTTPSGILGVSVQGGAAPLLTDPDGRRGGIDDAAQESYREIPNCEFERSASEGGISVTGPNAGTYTVTLSGTGAGEQHVLISYMDEETHEQKEVTLYYGGSTRTLSFVLNPGGEDIITIQAVPAPPTGLAATGLSQASSRITKLSWNAAGGGTIAGYRIYTRKDDEPRMVLLATTPAGVTQYQTEHLWGTPRRFYAVSAFDAQGNESLLSDTVANYIALKASFTATPVTGQAPLAVSFTDTSGGDVTGRLWQFGDGATSTQQNPSHTYAAAGTFTVSLTVTGPDGDDAATDTIIVSAAPQTTTTISQTGGGGGGGGTVTTTVGATTTSTTSVPATTTSTQPTTTSTQPTTTTSLRPVTTTTVRPTTTTTSIVAPPPASTTTTTAAGPCPVVQALGSDNPAALETLRNFRDMRLVKSPTGLLLTALYYKHAGEVAGILAADPGLSAEVKNVISELLPVIKTDGEIVLTPRQQEDITKLLEDIRKSASPGLRESISFILAKFRSGEVLKGLNRR